MEYADDCTWRYTDRSTSAKITLAVKLGSQNLEDVYGLRNTYATFVPTTVRAHPAVTASETEVDICRLVVAIADDQLMSVVGQVSGRPPAGDPCAPSLRMAELILSNLPPLR